MQEDHAKAIEAEWLRMTGTGPAGLTDFLTDALPGIDQWTMHGELTSGGRRAGG
jgi:hypothetical protein